MADNPLTRLPLVGQLALSVAFALLLIGGYWYFFHEPMDAEHKSKNAKYATLQADIRNLEVTANKLDEFRREVAAREQKLETLKRILPADKETADLMKRVQYLASQANLQIRKFTPGPTVRKEFEIAAAAPQPQASPTGKPTPAPRAPRGKQPAGKTAAAQPQEYYQEWPINVEVDGNYHNLGVFFDRVSRLSRLVTIGNVKIKPQQKPTATKTVNASCVATTYVYVEAPPQPQGQTTK
jgi:type IV pilus assembly protein PilO